MTRVRTNAWYTFRPVPLDLIHRSSVHPEPGQRVKVVNLPGCPKANTMGHCHIEDEQGNFRGLVHVNSLSR